MINVTGLGAGLIARTMCRAGGTFFWESQERYLTDGTCLKLQGITWLLSHFFTSVLGTLSIIFCVFSSPTFQVFFLRKH